MISAQLVQGVIIRYLRVKIPSRVPQDIGYGSGLQKVGSILRSMQIGSELEAVHHMFIFMVLSSYHSRSLVPFPYQFSNPLRTGAS